MSVAIFKQLTSRMAITVAATWSGTPLVFNNNGSGSFRVYNAGTKDAQVCVCDTLAVATAPGTYYFTLGAGQVQLLRGFVGPVYCNAQSSGGGTGDVEFVLGA